MHIALIITTDLKRSLYANQINWKKLKFFFFFVEQFSVNFINHLFNQKKILFFITALSVTIIRWLVTIKFFNRTVTLPFVNFLLSASANHFFLFFFGSFQIWQKIKRQQNQKRNNKTKQKIKTKNVALSAS